MILQTIVYVTDMARSLSFYEALGLEADRKAASAMWTPLRIGSAVLALHKTAALPERGSPRQVDVSFVSQAPLEDLAARLASAGISLARGIADEAFGRSLQVRDPDGMIIQINEHDATLLTR